MATATDLGAGGRDAAGRPIFIATDHTKYSPSTERELTDQEQLAWKSFQLWRVSLSMERRDSVYKTITNSDYTNFNLVRHMMGTPYPVVDHVPGFFDCVRSIRSYEHLFSAAVGYGYYKWICGKPSTRNISMSVGSKYLIGLGTFVLLEFSFIYRSMFRLSGFLPNDYECRKYGVVESKERLERKKELWEKYANYKKEWCRRFDYHVYGIRPGENFNIFSACWLPAWEPSYGKTTDYPLRKNPYFLSSTPLREMFVENPTFMEVRRSESVPLIRSRPELQYLFHGPLDAARKKSELE